MRMLKYFYSIGNEIIDNKRQLLILDREIRSKKNNGKISNRKWYKYKCLKCGNENWIDEYSLKNNHCGCNACCKSPQKVVIGINDIGTTDEWMIPFFKNKQDAFLYNKSSSKKVDYICPNCGKIHNMSIQNLYKRKYIPCICSDGMSFPNKFMYAFLNQLDINFEIEKKFDWSNNRVYDDYIIFNNIKIIVEMHGAQHYDKALLKSKRRFRTVEEEQNNDIYKKNLAIMNGIDYYFEIDAKKSTKEYLRDNIISSGLLHVLNIEPDDVDWDICLEFALSSFVKTICGYKNKNPNISISEIAKLYKLNRCTVYNYIKFGNELGWCNYKVNDDRKLPNRKNQKPIFCITDGYYYDCAKSIAEKYSIHSELIKRSIVNKTTYKNMKFEYITQEQFNKHKMESPTKVVGDFFNINN